MQIVLNDEKTKKLLKFSDPVEIVKTDRLREVKDCLCHIENEVKQKKLYAAGFVTYEAAPAFDEAFIVYSKGELPLVCFGLYSQPEKIVPSVIENSEYTLNNWLFSVSKEEYNRAIERIKDHIADGNTYQVNYTMRLKSAFSGDPYQLFLDLIEGQQSEYTAFVDTNSHAICSISPELFFKLENSLLTTKPMKGTAPRGTTLKEDKEMAGWLFSSEKNRAENVMIVDMLRNDMGQIAELGSVKVKSYFDIEKYPYVFQMTSTVESTTNESFFNIMKSLFPCGSITGAPKVQTMKIINDLESTPRGIYTGTIGFLSPDNRAQFNVAIRTITINKSSQKAEYGVGGGIIWDSSAEEEYRECQTKSGILHQKQRRFELIESILWQPKEGYYLLNNHLQRLMNSAEYFGFQIDLNEIQNALSALEKDLLFEDSKVRLIVDKFGEAKVEAGSLLGPKTSGLKVGLAKDPINSRDPFLYHKTTNRDLYENTLKENPKCDDVILWNEKGEITESCRSNVVIVRNDKMITPEIKCGLLGGTYRKHLLEAGKIVEEIVLIEDLKKTDKIFLINSVRKWMDAELMTHVSY